jgi:hypothetical protein
VRCMNPREYTCSCSNRTTGVEEKSQFCWIFFGTSTSTHKS